MGTKRGQNDVEDSPRSATSGDSGDYLSHSQTATMLSMVDDDSMISDEEGSYSSGEESIQFAAEEESAKQELPKQTNSVSSLGDRSLDSLDHIEKKNKMRAILSEYGLDEGLSSDEESALQTDSQQISPDVSVDEDENNSEGEISEHDNSYASESASTNEDEEYISLSDEETISLSDEEEISLSDEDYEDQAYSEDEDTAEDREADPTQDESEYSFNEDSEYGSDDEPFEIQSDEETSIIVPQEYTDDNEEGREEDISITSDDGDMSSEHSDYTSYASEEYEIDEDLDENDIGEDEQAKLRTVRRESSYGDTDPFASPKSSSASLRINDLNKQMEEVKAAVDASASSNDFDDNSIKSRKSLIDAENQKSHQGKLSQSSTGESQPTSDTSDADSHYSYTSSSAGQNDLSSQEVSHDDDHNNPDQVTEASKRKSHSKIEDKDTKLKSTKNAQALLQRTIRKITLGKNGAKIERTVQPVSMSKRKSRRSIIADSQQDDESSVESPILMPDDSNTSKSEHSDTFSKADNNTSESSEDLNPILLIRPTKEEQHVEESKMKPRKSSKTKLKNTAVNKKLSSSSSKGENIAENVQAKEERYVKNSEANPKKSSKSKPKRSTKKGGSSISSNGGEKAVEKVEKKKFADKVKSQGKASKKKKLSNVKRKNGKKSQKLPFTKPKKKSSETQMEQDTSESARFEEGEAYFVPLQNGATREQNGMEHDEDAGEDNRSTASGSTHASGKSRFLEWIRSKPKVTETSFVKKSRNAPKLEKKRSAGSNRSSFNDSKSSFASFGSIGSTEIKEQKEPKTPLKSFLKLFQRPRTPSSSLVKVKKLDLESSTRSVNTGRSPQKEITQIDTETTREKNRRKNYEEPKTVAQQRQERREQYILDQQRRHAIIIQASLRGYVERIKQGIRLPSRRDPNDESSSEEEEETFVDYSTLEPPSASYENISDKSKNLENFVDDTVVLSSSRPTGFGLRGKESFEEPKTVAQQREERRALYEQDRQRRNSVIIQAALRGHIARKQTKRIKPQYAQSIEQKLSYSPPQSPVIDRKQKSSVWKSFFRSKDKLFESKRSLHRNPSFEKKQNREDRMNPYLRKSFLRTKKEIPQNTFNSNVSNVAKFDASLYLRQRMYQDEQTSTSRSLVEIQDERRRMYLRDLERRESIKIQAAGRGFLVRKHLEGLKKRKPSKMRKNPSETQHKDVESRAEDKHIVRNTTLETDSFDRSKYLINRLQREEAARQMKSVKEIREERQLIYISDLKRREATKIEAVVRGFIARKQYPSVQVIFPTKRIRNDIKSSQIPVIESKSKSGLTNVMKRFLFRKDENLDEEQSFEKYDPYADSNPADFFGFKEAKRRHRTGFFELEKTKKHEFQHAAFTLEGRNWEGRAADVHKKPKNAVRPSETTKNKSELQKEAAKMKKKRSKRRIALEKKAKQEAAVKIQNIYRGFEARKTFKKLKRKQKKKAKKATMRREAKEMAKQGNLGEKTAVNDQCMQSKTMKEENSATKSIQPSIHGNDDAGDEYEESVVSTLEEVLSEEVVMERAPNVEKTKDLISKAKSIVPFDYKREIPKHEGSTYSSEIGMSYWLPAVGSEDNHRYRVADSENVDRFREYYYDQQTKKNASNPFWETVRTNFLSSDDEVSLAVLSTKIPRNQENLSVAKVAENDSWLPPGIENSRSIPMGEADDYSKESWVPLPTKKAHSRPKRVLFTGDVDVKEDLTWAPHLPSPSKRDQKRIAAITAGDIEAVVSPHSSFKKKGVKARRGKTSGGSNSQDIEAAVPADIDALDEGFIDVPLHSTKKSSNLQQLSQEKKDHRMKIIALLAIFLILLGAGAACAYFFWENAPWAR